MIKKQPKQLSKQEEKHIEKHVEKHVDKRLSDQLLTKGEFLGHQFKQHVSTAIIAAFSFLIALSWKDVILHAIESLVKEEILSRAPYLIELISAIVVTLVAILGIMLITTWAKKPHVVLTDTTTS